jgi:ubiquinone/menaquinone biosynthesis C-methylase UbiE
VSDDVRSRFGPVAANYRTSWFHADPERMQEIVVLCAPQPGDLALDVATGTGNTAFALAPHVEHVVGLDLTVQMLRQAERTAAERALANVSWVLGDAHALPFPDAAFDLYTVRAAPHHFPDLDLSVREAKRVLRPGGRAGFIDCSPPQAARDYLHQVEVARDPSHVRAYTLEEWAEAIEHAGLELESADRRALDWEFDSWMKTMSTPPRLAAELERIVEAAEGEAREQLHPERRDGRLRHVYWHALIRARKP